MARTAPKKMLKTKTSLEKYESEPVLASTIRLVVVGELLYDGDESLELLEQPSELAEVELAEIEDEATKEEL